ncbi:putative kinase [Arthrobacter sp. UYNi723]
MIIDPKRKRAVLVLMCGRSFSGKTTISRELAVSIDAEIVSLDSINEERGLFGGQGIPVEEWIRTNDEATRRVSAALERGGRVVVDDTSSPRFLRDNWRSLAADASSAFALVYVDTPEHITRRRLLNNRELANRNDVIDEVMAKHLESFEPPEPDEAHITIRSLTEDTPLLLAAVHQLIS